MWTVSENKSTVLGPGPSILQMNRTLIVAAMLTFGTAVFGMAAEAPSFEVATVKKAELPEPGKPMFFGRRGGPGTDDPGRITWSGEDLRSLLMTAYDVKRYQISGPDWMDSERYDIVAKVPAGSTKEQVNLMLQNLLADRFGVVLHHTSKVMAMYEMQQAKGGAKLKETTLDAKAIESAGPGELEGIPFGPPPLPPPGAGVPVKIPDGRGPAPGGRAPFPGAPELDKNGIPQLKAPGIIMMMTMGPNGPSARMVGKAQTTAQLASNLSNQLNRPVVDKTGLSGKYDFVVEFAPDFGGGRGPGAGGPGAGVVIGGGPGGGAGPGGGDGAQPGNASEPSGMTLAGAVQQQLGLRLVANKQPVDFLVIDKAEKTPTEN